MQYARPSLGGDWPSIILKPPHPLEKIKILRRKICKLYFVINYHVTDIKGGGSALIFVGTQF